MELITQHSEDVPDCHCFVFVTSWRTDYLSITLGINIIKRALVSSLGLFLVWHRTLYKYTHTKPPKSFLGLKMESMNWLLCPFLELLPWWWIVCLVLWLAWFFRVRSPVFSYYPLPTLWVNFSIQWNFTKKQVVRMQASDLVELAVSMLLICWLFPFSANYHELTHFTQL